MKRQIKSARYTTYQGHQIRINDGETTPQAVTRYRNQVAQEEADRLEAERFAKEEKERARAKRRRIPKYQDGDIVLGKDGRYYQVWEPYYNEEDDTVYYGTMPTNETGKWVVSDDIDDYRWWSDVDREMSQDDIQRRIRKTKASKVTASTDEISSQMFDQLVDSYKGSGAGWSLIVAELKGTYGLDLAKEVADTVCYERKQRPIKASDELSEASFGFDFIIVYNYSEDIQNIVENIVSDVFHNNGCEITGFELRDVTDMYARIPEYKEFDVFQVGMNFRGLYDVNKVIREIKSVMRDAGYQVIGNPVFDSIEE